MTMNANQLSGLLFKKVAAGKSDAAPEKPFFEEGINARSFVAQDQIWAESHLIPLVAPTLSSGVVDAVTDLELEPVPGASGAFAHPDLKDVIPFNWGDGLSYNYTIKDATGKIIPFGMNDWFLDTEVGVLTFFGGAPADMPPKISCWKYVGRKGGGGVQTVNGKQGDVTAIESINGKTGELTLEGGEVVTMTQTASGFAFDIDPSSVVQSLNGTAGPLTLVGVKGLKVEVIEDGEDGPVLTIGPEAMSMAGNHYHDGVDSPKISFTHLINIPDFVGSLNGIAGAVTVEDSQHIVVTADPTNKTLVFDTRDLVSLEQFGQHTHDGANSPKVNFSNLAGVPKLVRTVNGADGNLTIVGKDGHLMVTSPSGSPSTLEFEILGFALEEHDHDVVHTVNGVSGAPMIKAGDASIVVGVSGSEILLYATGASGQWEEGGMFNHAMFHASGGTDPITPEMIGAAAVEHGHDDLAPKLHDHDARYARVAHEHDYVKSLNGLDGNLNIRAASGGGLVVTETEDGIEVAMAAFAGGEDVIIPSHADQHGKNGTDPITPAMIGAAPANHSHNGEQLVNVIQSINGVSKKVALRADFGLQLSQFVDETDPNLTHMVLAVTGSSGLHAAQHAAGGGDPITPAMIGAATAGHLHDGRYSKLGHEHDARYSNINHHHNGSYAALGHGHNYVHEINGSTGKVHLKEGAGIRVTQKPAASGSGYDTEITITSLGAGGGAGNANTDEFTANLNQTRFKLTKDLDPNAPFALWVANVRQPKANYSYDVSTNEIVLAGWAATEGALVFVDYFYL